MDNCITIVGYIERSFTMNKFIVGFTILLLVLVQGISVYGYSTQGLVQLGLINNQTSMITPITHRELKFTNRSTDRVVDLVNEVRLDNGLKSLSYSPILSYCAFIRADEIEEVFSHTRPNGEKGLHILKEYGVSYMIAGENLAANFTSSERVVNAWMNSEGHRANILSPKFKEIGVARVGDCWVQLFKG